MKNVRKFKNGKRETKNSKLRLLGLGVGEEILLMKSQEKFQTLWIFA
jgi:hypothetical protein